MGRLLQFLFDALVLFFVVRLVVRLFAGGRPMTSRRPPAQTPERSGGTLVRDPQCGTYVSESRAIRATAGTTSLFFCSAACRDAYFAASGPVARSRT
jgi:hypothetical protein